jgi:hypothetical protein
MKVRRRCGSPLGALKVFFFVFSLETQYCPRSAVRSGPAVSRAVSLASSAFMKVFALPSSTSTSVPSFYVGGGEGSEGLSRNFFFHLLDHETEVSFLGDCPIGRLLHSVV